MKKKLLYSGIIVILLLIIAYFGVGNYFYNYALNAQDEKEFMEDNPNLEDSPFINAEAEAQSVQLDDDFKAAVQAEKWKIESNDKLNLKLQGNAYLQDSQHKWAIVLHGYTSSSAKMTRWIRNFYEQGFNVLAPDLRGHGESEGEYIGMGWHDRFDVLQWIDKVLAQDPEAEIVLFGVSMGGATAMMTAGESLPENVKVIVEDCGYSSVSGVFVYQLDDLFGLPEFPVLHAANTVTKMRAGYSVYEASAVEQVKKSTTPMLFIHGDADTFVPFEMLQEVYDAAPVEKDMLIVENAAHGDAVKVAPETYWQTVWTFIGKYI